jgi:hypothetical protein
MSKKDKPNSADGRNSYDSAASGELIAFFNRNVTPYPTEVGAPQFELVPVEKQKDIMLNVARMHAQQEYDRIMDLVQVLQKQAEEIKDRLDFTDQVHAAKYEFQPMHGINYWLVQDHKRGGTRLTQTGPDDWTTGAPAEYEYLRQVKWLGDYTWIEVK